MGPGPTGDLIEVVHHGDHFRAGRLGRPALTLEFQAVPLSVLELAPVASGSDARGALANAAQLAAHVDALGYLRLWVAEHHNIPGIASTAPAVLIAHLAAVSSRIRVGSGGVMLPNHAPLVVAEQFGMLEALHPGRIDLGIGRAPGTDPGTARALRRTVAGVSEDDFPQHLLELLAFFTGEFPEGHPLAGIRAVPGGGAMPELWLLGSSGYSAQVAALLGLPFSFAHHFSAQNTIPALELYRSLYRPSVEGRRRPHAMVAVSVLCADTDDRARYLAGPGALSFLRLRAGSPGPLPSPEEAASYNYSDRELEMVRARLSSQIIGSPKTVAAGLEALRAETAADEFMVVTMTHSQQDRLRSYELLADLCRAGEPVQRSERG